MNEEREFAGVSTQGTIDLQAATENAESLAELEVFLALVGLILDGDDSSHRNSSGGDNDPIYGPPINWRSLATNLHILSSGIETDPNDIYGATSYPTPELEPQEPYKANDPHDIYGPPIDWKALSRNLRWLNKGIERNPNDIY